MFDQSKATVIKFTFWPHPDPTFRIIIDHHITHIRLQNAVSSVSIEAAFAMPMGGIPICGLLRRRTAPAKRQVYFMTEENDAAIILHLIKLIL